MKWWQKALLGSLIWTLVIVITDLYMMQRIKQEAHNASHRDAWETQLGQASGEMFFMGGGAIWYFAWRKQRRSDNKQNSV